MTWGNDQKRKLGKSTTTGDLENQRLKLIWKTIIIIDLGSPQLFKIKCLGKAMTSETKNNTTRKSNINKVSGNRHLPMTWETYYKQKCADLHLIMTCKN